jgi:hypothetical protein
VHHDWWVVTADGAAAPEAVVDGVLVTAGVLVAAVVLLLTTVAVVDFELASAGSLPDASCM